MEKTEWEMRMVSIRKRMPNIHGTSSEFSRRKAAENEYGLLCKIGRKMGYIQPQKLRKKLRQMQ